MRIYIYILINKITIKIKNKLISLLIGKMRPNLFLMRIQTSMDVWKYMWNMREVLNTF
jgi:hypothetical protein